MTINSVVVRRRYDQELPKVLGGTSTIRKTYTVECDLTWEQYMNEKERKEYYYENPKNTIVITVDNTTRLAQALVRLDKKTDWVYGQFRNIKCGWKLAVCIGLWEMVRPYILH